MTTTNSDSPLMDDESRFAPDASADGLDLPELDVHSEMAALAAELESLGSGLVAFQGIMMMGTPASSVPDQDFGEEVLADDDLFDLEVEDDAPGIAQRAPLELDTTDLFPREDMDVEAALAAVSNLPEMIAETEARERAVLAGEEATRQRQAELRTNPLQRPVALVLRRGNVASVLPALALIGVGAWLTFRYTTGQPVPLLWLASAGVGLLSLGLFSAWLASGRWSKGVLFIAVWLVASLFAGWAALVALAQPGYLPAFLGIAAGLAVLLAGLWGRPFERRYLRVGIVLMVAGAAGALLPAGFIRADVLALVNQFGIYVLLAMAVILVLPGFFQRIRKR